MRKLLPLVVLLSALLVSSVALAQRKPPPSPGGGNPFLGETYEFFVGLLSLFPNFDPVIMAADNGDRLEIRGDGAFTIWPKVAHGGGTFVHKDATGNEVRRGRWLAVEFLSFVSYGFGGQVGLRIDLIPDGQPDAIPGKMQIDCPLGDAPPSAVFEARVVFQDSGLNFNQRVQGGTFLYRIHVDPPLCQGGLQGTCAHNLCRVGGPLDPACEPEFDATCVASICAVDPICCGEYWDQGCIDAVESVCGMCCCTKGIVPCD
ncbi:MAG TPA: hypothetical protein VGV60_04975 [Candidatus Polarisedimenticolia bacterium]|jgi:hypothetical protein|nr:hypothetical protein [Candidatus Polarisedimenticolia bacterium]